MTGRRRRIIVGRWVLESPEMRTFRHAATGMTVEQIMAEPRHGYREPGPGALWCAACWDDYKPDQRSVPIYPGTELPEEDSCARCDVSLRELQASMKDVLSG